MKSKMDLSEIVNRLGEDRSEYYNAVVPPIVQTSNFSFDTTGDFIEAIKDEYKSYIYSRGNNPTVDLLREKLAAMEGADDCLILASGTAAISTAVLGCVKGGDHIICVKDCYSWTKYLLTEVLPKYGITTTFIDSDSIQDYVDAVQSNTKLLFLESPTTFTFKIQDLEKLAGFARQHGLTSIIDNSYGAAISQHPLELGIDIVIYSASKYVGGHSDIVAGVICSSEQIIHRLFKAEFLTLGGICSPFNAWLMLRSIRTMEIRVMRSSTSALKVAEFLKNSTQTEKVHFPFLKEHPSNKLATKHFKYCMGLFSVEFRVKNSSQIREFCDNLKVFQMAVSWGGHESLVFPACVITEAGRVSDLPANLVRFYIGMEDPDLLISDIKGAMKFLTP